MPGNRARVYLIHHLSFSSSSTIATRKRNCGSLKEIFEEICEMPPVAEKLCFVNQFYLYFANRRLERPNDSFYVFSNVECFPPISTAFDSATALHATQAFGPSGTRCPSDKRGMAFVIRLSKSLFVWIVSSVDLLKHSVKCESFLASNSASGQTEPELDVPHGSAVVVAHRSLPLYGPSKVNLSKIFRIRRRGRFCCRMAMPPLKEARCCLHKLLVLF